MILKHSGRVNSRDCPTLGCSRRREVSARVKWPDGTQRAVSACEKCLPWYVARAIMREVKYRGGQKAVEEFVDLDAGAPEQTTPAEGHPAATAGGSTSPADAETGAALGDVQPHATEQAL